MAKHVRGGGSPRRRRDKRLNHIDNIVVVERAASEGTSGRADNVVGNTSFAENAARKRRRNRILLAIVCIIAALALAAAGAVAIYLRTVDSNLELSDSNASDALEEASPGTPYYVLCLADLSDTAKLARSPEDLAAMVARVDASEKILSFMGIPASLALRFPDGNQYSLNGLPAKVSDAETIEAVSGFMDVPIAHFVYTDAAKLSEMIDAAGGVEMMLDTEIDDPSAGNIVVRAGMQDLSANEALTVLRATNVMGGFETCSAMRVDFTVGLLGKALGGGSLSLPSLVSDASKYISTDWSASSLLSDAEALEPFSDVAVYSFTVPYYKAAGSDDGMLSLNRSEWQDARDAFVNGSTGGPEEVIRDDDGLRDATVEVRNGTSVEGEAAKLAEDLEGLGYTVEDVGNTQEGITYPETLIIYTDPSNEEKAKKVLSDLSQGRIVDGGDFYNTESDVLVIIGSDWNSMF